MNLSDLIVLLAGSSISAILVKSTLVLLAVPVPLYAAQRQSAAVRHAIIACAFALLVAIPLVTFVAPGFHVSVRAHEEVVGGVAAFAPTATVIAQNGGTLAPDSNTISTTFDWSRIALVAWLCGVVFLECRQVQSLWILRRLRLAARPGADSSFSERLKNIREANVEVLIHEDVPAPIAFGLIRRVIILPETAIRWSQQDLERAMVHEHEHFRRHDWAIQLAAHAVCAIYWFHPLAWRARQRLLVEAERACDDAVLAQSDETEYAGQLISLARGLATNSHRLALGMARQTDLATRVRAILDPIQSRGRMRAHAWAGVISCGMFTSFAMVPITPEFVDSGRPAAVNCDDTPRQRRLLEAAQFGRLARVAALLEAGVNANCALNGDGTPLIAAARGGHEAVVQLLLRSGADPNLAAVKDANPLIAAAASGLSSTVTLLLEAGARINDTVHGDENALVQAARRGRADVVSLLISWGANVNAQFRIEPRRGQTRGELRTALSVAQSGGHTDVVRLLIAAGATR